MTTQRKKRRLQRVFAMAVALGCSSATLSGVLGSLAIQQPISAQAAMA